VPQPIQQPSPPILIGGSGEKKTLRLVAQYGDACNLFSAGTDAVKHKLDVLAQHCDDLGRDPLTIRKTMLNQGDPLADVDAFLSSMEEYAKLGISVVGLMPNVDDPAAYVAEVCDKVVPRLSEIGN
jgi:esterase/lipase superfamily enzyme